MTSKRFDAVVFDAYEYAIRRAWSHGSARTTARPELDVARDRMAKQAT